MVTYFREFNQKYFSNAVYFVCEAQTIIEIRGRKSLSVKLLFSCRPNFFMKADNLIGIIFNSSVFSSVNCRIGQLRHSNSEEPFGSTDFDDCRKENRPWLWIPTRGERIVSNGLKKESRVAVAGVDESTTACWRTERVSSGYSLLSSTYLFVFR